MKSKKQCFDMKIVTFFLLLVSTSLFAQDKIEGIGRFKINKTTTSLLDTLAKEYGVKITKISKDGDFRKIVIKNESKNKNCIIELLKNLSDDRIDQIPFAYSCEATRVFYIQKYEVAGIGLTELYITFIDDKLISIFCNYDAKVKEALRLKYGAGKVEYETKEIRCVYKLTGNIVTEEEYSSSEDWTNGNIVATLSFSRSYDNECKKEITSYLLIKNTPMYSRLLSCEYEAKKKLKTSLEKAKKASLDGF
jgi:hypothetical protein